MPLKVYADPADTGVTAPIIYQLPFICHLFYDHLATTGERLP